MHIYPNCTLVTACYNFNNLHKAARSPAELLDGIKTVLQVPFYLVIYCDNTMTSAIREERAKYGLQDVTRVYEIEFEKLWAYQFLDKVKANRLSYHPTRDERTSAETHLITCNKFDFVLQTIESNPFSTSKFGWIDSVVRENMAKICENYNHSLLYKVLTSISDKFHIQILNVCDKKYKNKEHKREFYQQYRWIVCGSFFTCGKEIGRKVLTRLKEVVSDTTQEGYGHGEEMFYLEVLDEFYEDIARAYGDYGQILNNFLQPTRNIYYIVHCIIKGYSNLSYHRECYDCCIALVRQIEDFNIHISYDLMLEIYFYLFLSSFYYKHEEAKDVVKKIRLLCDKNPYFNQEFQRNKDFYTSQFAYVDN
jgi:hypothetical protein